HGCDRRDTRVRAYSLLPLEPVLRRRPERALRQVTTRTRASMLFASTKAPREGLRSPKYTAARKKRPPISRWTNAFAGATVPSRGYFATAVTNSFPLGKKRRARFETTS